MENLRAATENDLHDSLEGEWKIPVELIDPDGNVQNMSALNPLETLGGQVLYYAKQMQPESGEPVVVYQPVVTLRIASLRRVPVPGERWIINMPIGPRVGDPIYSFPFGVDKSLMHGTDIGFIRFYPQRIDQGSEPIS